MKKFKCTVTRVDEYEIEFDEEVINDEFIKEYAEYFADYETLEEHAENLAQYQARFGSAFMEGYGVVKKNGKIPYPYNTKEYEGKISKEELGINIKIISEDNDCDVEVEEIF